MIEPLPSFAKVFSLVVQEERQRSICVDQFPVPETVMIVDSSVNAFFAVVSDPSNGCKLDLRDIYFCTYCKTKGHSRERCYKLDWLSYKFWIFF